MAEKKIIQPFLKHDENTQMDENIAELIHVMGYEGYGLYWSIAEFMHKNKSVRVGKEYLVSGDTEKITKILNDFDLFRIEDECYISDRILRDLKITEEKSAKASESVETRWLLSTLNKAYKDVFGFEVELSSDEIQILKKYNKKIPDFRAKLPDIIYTLKFVKFDNDSSFNAGINWLLEKNNMRKLLNGEWGKLRKKPDGRKKETPKEPVEVETFNIDDYKTKEQAIEYIVSHNNGSSRFMTPMQNELIAKFVINSHDIYEWEQAHKKDNTNENEHE